MTAPKLDLEGPDVRLPRVSSCRRMRSRRFCSKLSFPAIVLDGSGCSAVFFGELEFANGACCADPDPEPTASQSSPHPESHCVEEWSPQPPISRLSIDSSGVRDRARGTTTPDDQTRSTEPAKDYPRHTWSIRDNRLRQIVSLRLKIKRT